LAEVEDAKDCRIGLHAGVHPIYARTFGAAGKVPLHGAGGVRKEDVREAVCKRYNEPQVEPVEEIARPRHTVVSCSANMKNAAFGIRVHSGWAVLVCVSGNPAAASVVDRRRIVIIESAMEGAKQPYHFAESLSLEGAERHIEKCAAVSRGLAVQAIHEMLDGVTARKYRVLSSAMLLASGRALPSLQKILASHALIHTAEGEFFRNVVREACEHFRIPVMGIRERELDERANATLGKAAARVRQQINGLGKTVGSPWTHDEKAAALAALIALKNAGLTPPQ